MVMVQQSMQAKLINYWYMLYGIAKPLYVYLEACLVYRLMKSLQLIW